MSDDLPIPPNVPKWFPAFIKALRKWAHGQWIDYCIAAVYAQLWRESRLKIALIQLCKYTGTCPYRCRCLQCESYIRAGENAETCAAKMRKLAK